ncbi:hypothetical protein [Roseibium album]|uniref:hypothetical protein n=1 Tax=Roseibium album TaxID=311410 RepID=UPI00329897CC
MLSVTVGDWKLSLEDVQQPLIKDVAKEKARFVDEVSAPDEWSRCLSVSVSKADDFSDRSDAVIILKFQDYGGFEPGVLLVPETPFLFVGAGEILLGYDLERRERSFEDYVYCGFWGWHRFGDIVLMASETECSAWSLRGKKLWSADVEPPWDFEVSGLDVILVVEGGVRKLDLKTGKARNRN